MLFVCLIITTGTLAAETSLPYMPLILQGNIEVAGEPAPVGTEITAELNGKLVGITRVTSEGVYGDGVGNKLFINCNPDNYDDVKFYVNDVESQVDLDPLKNANSGNVIELNIIANSGEKDERRAGNDPIEKQRIIQPDSVTTSVTTVPGIVTNDLNDPGLTPQDLASTLMCGNFPITNVNFIGANRAAGTFSGGAGIIDFDSGIILSTGDISSVIGPNTADGTSTNNGLPGDADLTSLISESTNDAAVLEFDFVPNCSVLTFKFVFGSEEYYEWANSDFNDVFGLFVNGNNVALVPVNLPVSVNNVNLVNNAGLYRDNELPGATIDTELDGLTVVLTATANVNAGQTNHIKLAIADVNDNIFDSDVFIESCPKLSCPIPHSPPIVVTELKQEILFRYVTDDFKYYDILFDGAPTPPVPIINPVIIGPPPVLPPTFGVIFWSPELLSVEFEKEFVNANKVIYEAESPYSPEQTVISEREEILLLRNGTREVLIPAPELGVPYPNPESGLFLEDVVGELDPGYVRIIDVESMLFQTNMIKQEVAFRWVSEPVKVVVDFEQYVPVFPLDVAEDEDLDGLVDEDPADGIDNDGDGKVDEDEPLPPGISVEILDTDIGVGVGIGWG